MNSNAKLWSHNIGEVTLRIIMNLIVLFPEMGDEDYDFRVKLDPVLTVQKVLDIVCLRHNLDPTKYVLSYKKTFLDNEDKFKDIGIPSNAVLELCCDFRPKGDLCVRVTLKVKDTLCSAYFHPDVTLWTVVQNLIATDILDIPSSTPVLIHKNEEYIGKKFLKEFTLFDVGYTKGNAYFRFMLVNNGILSKRCGPLGSSDSLPYENTGTRFFIRDTRLSFMTVGGEHHVKYHPGVKARGSSIMNEINYLDDERKVVIFRIPEASQFVTVEEPEDSFYDLTVTDVQMLYRQLQRERRELEEQPLLTKKKREELEKERASVHTKAVIRVEFPDRIVLQAVFSPEEKIKDVEEVVSKYVRVKLPFCLFSGPPKTMLDPEDTLSKCNLVPTGKVFYKIVYGVHPKLTAYLEEEYLKSLTSHEAACHAAAVCRSTKSNDSGKNEKMEMKEVKEEKTEDTKDKENQKEKKLEMLKSKLLKR